jgi:hypothetical protein
MAGGIVDLAPYAIDSFINEEANEVMKFGIGVVAGTVAGTNIKKPASGATAATFEGITTNNLTTEYNLDGKVRILNKAPVGVMRYGRIYAKVATGITTAYGDPLYLVVSGDEAGYVTNSSTGTVALKGRFMGAVDATNGVAEVELFNQAQS